VVPVVAPEPPPAPPSVHREPSDPFATGLAAQARIQEVMRAHAPFPGASYGPYLLRDWRQAKERGDPQAPNIQSERDEIEHKIQGWYDDLRQALTTWTTTNEDAPIRSRWGGETRWRHDESPTRAKVENERKQLYDEFRQHYA